MIKKLLLPLILLGICCSAFSQAIQSPEKFLGYKPGEQFTPHYKIVEYFKYIAGASKNTKLVQYGSTNEGRPLWPCLSRLTRTSAGWKRSAKIT